MFTTNSSGIENFDYGVSRETVDDGQITVIRTTGDMSRDGVNTWASLLILTMQEWKSERPLALLHDYTHPNQGLTPYTRERAVDILKHRPEHMVVYNAIVLPDTFMRRIIDMFLRTPPFQHDMFLFRIFGTEEQAKRWLHESLNS